MTITRRNLASLAAFSVATAAAIPARAQSPAGDPAAVERQAEALRKLMVDPDRAALERIVADQLSYGHSDGRVQNKQEFIDSLVNKTSVFHSITLSNQTVSLAGDVAIVRHRFDADAVSNGKPGHPHIGVLQIWQKQGGDWKLLARQAS